MGKWQNTPARDKLFDMKRMLVIATVMLMLANNSVLAQKHVVKESTLAERKQLEVALKLVLDWHNASAQGKVFKLSFSPDLNPLEVGNALVGEGVTCNDRGAFAKPGPDQTFEGPLFARLVPDLAGLDSASAAKAFPDVMASAEPMRSWEDPCIQGHAFLNFTKALQDELQIDQRTLYLLIYVSSPKIKLSKSDPIIRLALKKDMVEAKEVSRTPVRH